MLDWVNCPLVAQIFNGSMSKSNFIIRAATCVKGIGSGGVAKSTSQERAEKPLMLVGAGLVLVCAILGFSFW